MSARFCKVWSPVLSRMVRVNERIAQHTITQVGKMAEEPKKDIQFPRWVQVEPPKHPRICYRYQRRPKLGLVRGKWICCSMSCDPTNNTKGAADIMNIRTGRVQKLHLENDTVDLEKPLLLSLVSSLRSHRCEMGWFGPYIDYRVESCTLQPYFSFNFILHLFHVF